MAAQSVCNFDGFLRCRDTFNLQGCIDACPYTEAACPPGTPPDSKCTDKACSDTCWDKGTEHGSSCASANNCTLEEIQAGLQGNEWRKRQALWVFVAIGLTFIVIFGLYGRRLTKNGLSFIISLVKTNFNVGIIVVLVIGLLVGYVVYPFINPSQKQTTQTQDGKTAPQSDWTTFKNEQYDISFDYPTSWTVEPSSQVFENGDVVAVQFTGETQQPNTDFYDGARFIVMVPQTTNLDLNSWVNSKYSASDQISDTNINGIAFKKVYTCGLGCFTYYYTIISGKVYGVLAFAEGSKKAEYQAVIDHMLNTLVIPK